MPTANEINNKNVWVAIALAVITSITSLGTALIAQGDSSSKEEKIKSAEVLNKISIKLGALDSSVNYLTRSIDKMEEKVDKNTERSIAAYAALSSADMSRSKGVRNGIKKRSPTKHVSPDVSPTVKYSDDKGEWTPAFSIPSNTKKKKKIKRKKKKKRRIPASIEQTSTPSHLDKSLLTSD